MRIRNVVLIGLAFFSSATFAAPEDPWEGGKWDAPIAWPFVPVSAASLPDGRILGWASNERYSFPAGPERTYTAVWDPYSGQFMEIVHPSHDMFCSNQVMLEDGSVYVTGGRNQGSSPWTSRFDYRTNQWIQRENMNRGRWYPTSLALPDGKVFIAIGEGATNTAELWDGVSQWTLLSGLNFDVPILSTYASYGERNWTPLMQLAPDGRILHLGPTPQMHMIETAGIGRITPVGPQITGWYPKDSATVVYDEGKILTAGGWIAGNNTVSSARAMVIDINGGAPAVTNIGPMNFARRFHNGVTLPTGEVVLIGGNTSGEKFSDVGSVFAVELWNPTTQAFRLGASMAVPRNYHSVALLMIDGRVWSGGGGLCGCSADHADAQIWSPPYLFNTNGTAATRPELYSVPGVVAVGSTIAVRGTAGMTKFSLVKMSAETHSNNTDMRFLSASFQETVAGEYAVTLNTNVNVLTPGFWMLFGLNAQGAPSVAKVIQVSTRGLSSGPPVLRDIASLSHAKNATIDMTLQVVEPDGDPLTFTATGLPPGVTLGVQSGRLTGAVTTSGTYSVTLSVADGQGSDSTSFTWRVLDNPGLVYQYYTGSFDVLPNFDALTPAKTGIVANFTLAPRTVEDFYAFRFRGRVDITTAGSYTFFTSSDDGSKLLIDGALIVNNDGLHGTQESSGVVTLGGGAHTIEVTFFEKTGGAALTVSYQGPGITKQLMPDAVLRQPAPPNQAPVVTSPGDQAGTIGQSVTLGIAASDPDGDALTFTATGLPSGLNINSATGVISGTLNGAVITTTRVTASDGPLNSTATFTWSVSAPNVAPTIAPIPNQASLVGEVVSLAVSANDANGDPITYSATGLPSDLSINQATGLIEGTIAGSVGTYSVVVTASDNTAQNSTSFNWGVSVPVIPITVQPIASAPHEAGVQLDLTVSATGPGVLRYQWSYGDGTSLVPFQDSPTGSHSYTNPGRYIVTVTVSNGSSEASFTFTQAIYAAHTAVAPAQDSTIITESVTTAERVWNVNPDTGTVTVIDATTLTKLAEIPVGVKPSSLALGRDGWIWVTNKGSDSISRINANNPNGFTEATTISLPRGSQPHGIVVEPVGGDALVVLEALGQLLKINEAGAVTAQIDVGAHARHLSVSSDGSRVYVARFVTPPLVDENTTSPLLLRNDQPAGGEVLVLDGTDLSVITTVVLEHSDAVASEHSGPGLPNYLRAPTISPDGLSAWVPSKQDNIRRGSLRSLQPLDHDHTVRAITSRINLATLTNDAVTSRIDHDNASIPAAAAFDRTGSYLFIALEGNRMVAVVDAYAGQELFRFAAGRAPEGLVMSADGRRMFVQNFMDRSVTVHDLSVLINTGANLETRLATISTVGSETFSTQVLLGKQHFYDSLDGRVTKQAYMSCASCHNDGGQDGRTWDFTGFGEGLRNTITLNGQGGIANGPVHWTGNFDEIQDFEGQMRNFELGLGLMDDVDFHTGTRDQPLGIPKAGLSPDLDALAAYVGSLNTVAKSPYRASNGTLTASAEAGKSVFVAKDCASCHKGNGFTDSAINVRHDIGTSVQPTSGSRLGGALDGFDTPTLRGLWSTQPYLHDGSAATLADAVDAHSGMTLSSTERSNLVDYLLQIDVNEPAAVGPTPKLEALMVTGVSSAGWTPVALAARYQNLVATCTVQQTNNTAPQVVRMRTVAVDRFEIRLQNPEGSALLGEKVYCLAAEEGNWKLSDGRKFEAHKYQSTRVDRAASWVGELRSYGQSYVSPVVLGQVMSYNDARWSAFWSRGSSAKSPVSASALYTGYMIGEDPVTTRLAETIGYMVIESGTGTASGILYEAKLGADTVRGWDNNTTGYTYTLSRSYPGPRLAVVSQSGMGGADGSFSSIRGSTGLTATTVRLVADEDNNKDTERSHGTERVGYFVIDQPAAVDLTPSP